MTDASELDMYHDLPNVDFATLHGFDGRRLLEITRSRLSQSADLPRQDVRGVSIATHFRQSDSRFSSSLAGSRPARSVGCSEFIRLDDHAHAMPA